MQITPLCRPRWLGMVLNRTPDLLRRKMNQKWLLDPKGDALHLIERVSPYGWLSTALGAGSDSDPSIRQVEPSLMRGRLPCAL